MSQNSNIISDLSTYFLYIQCANILRSPVKSKNTPDEACLKDVIDALTKYINFHTLKLMIIFNLAENLLANWYSGVYRSCCFKRKFPGYFNAVSRWPHASSSCRGMEFPQKNSSISNELNRRSSFYVSTCM